MISLSLRVVRRLPPSGFAHHNTRTFGRLLGPCFKTGGMRSFLRQACTRRFCSTVPHTEPQRENHSLGNSCSYSAKPAHDPTVTPPRCSAALSTPAVSRPTTATTSTARRCTRLAQRLGTAKACLSHARLAPSVRRGVPCPYRPTISSPFNSLSKVLFIFPSQYLFAIGFP